MVNRIRTSKSNNVLFPKNKDGDKEQIDKELAANLKMNDLEKDLKVYLVRCRAVLEKLFRLPVKIGLIRKQPTDFFLTAKYMHDVMSQLSRWFDDYNENAPHKGLKMMSPRQYLRVANGK